MKASEIEVGGTYSAKISDKAVAVRIERKHPRGGWEAMNLHTGRKVHIKSAQKLRCRVSEQESSDVAATVDAVEKGNLAKGVKVPAGGKKQKLTKKQQEALRAQAKADQENARVREERAAAPDGMTASERAMAESESAAPAPKAKGAKRTRGRVFAATGGERAALAKATADLPLSNNHIAFGRNGEIYELYFREHNGSPAIWKAKASVAVDELGFRSDGATLLQTGVDAVRQMVKKTTGKTPSQIGIGLSEWQQSRSSGKSAPAKPKRLSLIDAAAQVLAESKEPMSCRQMVEAVVAKGLWESKAATPHATLYSAILRENKKQGAEARFQKVDRGRFTLTDAEKEG